MNKILLNKAIKDDSVFVIQNNNREFSQPYYNSINGRIKFTKLKRLRLSEYTLEGEYPREILENPLVQIELEYINLNQGENSIDIFENNCKLVDLDNYSFKILSVNGYGLPCGVEQEIYKIFNIDSKPIGVHELLPKIKHRIELFFLVPDEDTEYFFEIRNGNIEEI